MLKLILDENIKPEIARQVTAARPEISITSVHFWEKGRLRGTHDAEVILSATNSGLTLVTYDVCTIPSLLVQLANESQSHCGVVFINNASIRSSDFGELIRALIKLYDEEKDASWIDRVYFLRPTGER